MTDKSIYNVIKTYIITEINHNEICRFITVYHILNKANLILSNKGYTILPKIS